jgi:hypothetical protein
MDTKIMDTKQYVITKYYRGILSNDNIKNQIYTKSKAVGHLNTLDETKKYLFKLVKGINLAIISGESLELTSVDYLYLSSDGMVARDTFDALALGQGVEYHIEEINTAGQQVYCETGGSE